MADDMQEMIAHAVRERRRALGLSQRELAEAVGFGSHQIVSELERGRRDVKAWELARIADVLQTTLPALLELERADRNETRVFWRTDVSEADRCRHEAAFLARIHRYRTVEELVGVSGPTEKLPRIGLDPRPSLGEVERAASRIRRSLDLGGRPAMSLVEILEERFGVKLFFDDLASSESAACLRTAGDAAILLNRTWAPWRRRLDVARQLFHLVTWDAVLESWPRSGQEVAWPARFAHLANDFASALLLPGEELRADFRSRCEDAQAPDAAFVELARSYGVSTGILLRRLAALGLVTERAVRDRLGRASFRKLDRASMAARWTRPPPDLPHRFVRLVTLAYQAGHISRSVAAEYLERDPGELHHLDWDEDDGWAGDRLS